MGIPLVETFLDDQGVKNSSLNQETLCSLQACRGVMFRVLHEVEAAVLTLVANPVDRILNVLHFSWLFKILIWLSGFSGSRQSYEAIREAFISHHPTLSQFKVLPGFGKYILITADETLQPILAALEDSSLLEHDCWNDHHFYRMNTDNGAVLFKAMRGAALALLQLYTGVDADQSQIVLQRFEQAIIQHSHVIYDTCSGRFVQQNVYYRQHLFDF